MIDVAVIGAGGWGKNLVRNFAQIDTCRLAAVCDTDDGKLARAKAVAPEAATVCDAGQVFGSSEIDAVVIATPAPTHFELARRALEAGKHTYVEKPLTLSPEEAETLVRLADEKDLRLMVGHLLEYHPCVRKLKDLIDGGELGDVYYAYLQRLNLGVVRKEENAWWSLAPHDISVVMYLFGAQPTTVTAQGQAYLRHGVEDTVFAQLKFADGRMAAIHVSWLDPHKIRKATLVGSRKMATFDDMEPIEKVRVYDKSADVTPGSVSYEDAISIRQGGISIPYVAGGEPLRTECEHFLECIGSGAAPTSDGRDGLRVVRVLEAGSRSLAAGGAPVEL